MRLAIEPLRPIFCFDRCVVVRLGQAPDRAVPSRLRRGSSSTCASSGGTGCLRTHRARGSTHVRFPGVRPGSVAHGDKQRLSGPVVRAKPAASRAKGSGRRGSRRGLWASEVEEAFGELLYSEIDSLKKCDSIEEGSDLKSFQQESGQGVSAVFRVRLLNGFAGAAGVVVGAQPAADVVRGPHEHRQELVPYFFHAHRGCGA